MKIILLKDVAKVGQHGTIKEVSDGYALNFLIARGLAVQATPEKVKKHEEEQKREGEKRERESKALAVAVASLRGARIELSVRATEKGGLFRSVGPKEIGDALQQQKGVALPEEAIHPLEPIKAIGDHIIKISASGAETEIMLKIVAI